MDAGFILRLQVHKEQSSKALLSSNQCATILTEMIVSAVPTRDIIR